MRRGIVSAIVAVMLVVAGVGGAPAQDDDERTHSTEHFSITWADDGSSADAPDLTDEDGDGVPDAIEEIAAAFEAARAFELDLGYREPPVDGRYPLYVGVTDDRGRAGAAPGGTGRSQPSYIVVPRWLLRPGVGDADRAAFAAHEYFHAIQIGYDSREDNWIGEASATWIEDVFDDASDANHDQVMHFLPYPRAALDSTVDEHEYGAFLFVQFIVERLGGGGLEGAELVREMWELMAVPEALPGAPDMHSLEAIEEVLRRRGSSFPQVWGEFLLWQRRLRHFEEGGGYRIAATRTAWPPVHEIRTVRSESCRRTMTLGEDGLLVPLSGDFSEVRPARRGPRYAPATLTAEGPPGSAGFYFIKDRRRRIHEFLLSFDHDGIARASVPFGRREVKKVVVGLGNGAPASDAAEIAFSLRLPGARGVVAEPPSGPAALDYGVAGRLTGRVLCAKRPAAFAEVTVTGVEDVSGETRTFSATTNGFGYWSVVVDPRVNSRYSASVVDPLLSSATSGAKRVAVRVSVTIDLSSDTLDEGVSLTVTGVVAPVHPGAPVAVEIRRPDGRWRIGAETSVGPDGAYDTELMFPADGIWEARARVSDTGDRDHAPGSSGIRKVRVRKPS